MILQLVFQFKCPSTFPTYIVLDLAMHCSLMSLHITSLMRLEFLGCVICRIQLNTHSTHTGCYGGLQRVVVIRWLIFWKVFVIFMWDLLIGTLSLSYWVLLFDSLSQHCIEVTLGRILWCHYQCLQTLYPALHSYSFFFTSSMSVELIKRPAIFCGWVEILRLSPAVACQNTELLPFLRRFQESPHFIQLLIAVCCMSLFITILRNFLCYLEQPLCNFEFARQFLLALIRRIRVRWSYTKWRTKLSSCLGFSILPQIYNLLLKNSMSCSEVLS